MSGAAARRDCPRTYLGLRASDWGFFAAFALALVLMVVSLTFASQSGEERRRRERAEFMASCEAHEPHYRCVVQWRELR